VKPSSAAVLAMLRRHPEGVTPLMALEEARCLRLAARISDLRAEGYPIRSELVVKDDKRWARYTLVTKPEQLAAFG
jgi:hypothetical protein